MSFLNLKKLSLLLIYIFCLILKFLINSYLLTRNIKKQVNIELRELINVLKDNKSLSSFAKPSFVIFQSFYYNI